MPHQEGTDAHPTCSTGRRPGFAIRRLSRTQFAIHTVRARGDKTAEHERDAGLVADTGDLSHPELGTSEFAFLRRRRTQLLGDNVKKS
jgi:hypothetical protein